MALSRRGTWALTNIFKNYCFVETSDGEELHQEADLIIQVIPDWFWKQNGSKGGGEKWSDLGYILKAELIAFTDRFCIDSLKEKVKNDSRVFAHNSPTEERMTVREQI